MIFKNPQKQFNLVGFLIIISILFFSLKVVKADEFTSTDFKVLDPVIVSGGGFATSSAFQLWGSIAELALGTSSVGSFQLGAGFLRYPFASTPSVSATAGNTEVLLTWSASSGFSGWTPSSYSIGRSTVSGGPYSYTSLGNVLTSTQTGLTNGTTYYFVVRVKDALGNFIATSTQVSATPASSGSGGGGGGGGGGGNPSVPTGNSGVIFSGRAYPLSRVTILKDGQIVLTTIAGPDSNFNATLSNLASGSYTFGVYGEDKSNIKSNLFTFPIVITSGVVTKIGGIFIAPTISVDKNEVKKGENIAIFGQSVPSSDVIISVNSEVEHFKTNKADKDGIYLLNFDTSVLELGQHHTKSKSAFGSEISEFSNTVAFIVGTKTIPNEILKCNIRGDLNNDCRVNLVDFSIAAFWYKKATPPVNVDLNKDKKVDLIDFSIMAFNWTG